MRNQIRQINLSLRKAGCSSVYRELADKENIARAALGSTSNNDVGKLSNKKFGSKPPRLTEKERIAKIKWKEKK